MTTKRERQRANRVARQAAQPGSAPKVAINDGFQNLEARLGKGAGNLQDASRYVSNNPITRNPRELEAMYRGSWVVGAVVDAVADDMTRAGIDYNSTVPPDVIDAMNGMSIDLGTSDAMGDVVRWGRLYGGAIGVLMIDGQDPSTPLRHDTVKQGAFRGILALDRWSLLPTSPVDVITEMGPDIGKPVVYQIGPNAPAMQHAVVHHSRVIRHDGVKLPFIQRQYENGWGQSVVERMFDRLLAFDSTTTGAAQLVYKAYLRTLKVTGLRQILAAGGQAEQALTKQMEGIRRFQQTEGLTLLDATDEFETHDYTFSGLDDILLQFGTQLSGATEIPMVRLFGQSPAGLNSTGESDLRNYYDGISSKQNRSLKTPYNRVTDLIYRSTTGEKPKAGFGYTFNPLWQLTEEQRAKVATDHGTVILAAEEQGVIDRATALRELKQSGQVTGVFTNITDKMIKEAENDPPKFGEDMGEDVAGGNDDEPVDGRSKKPEAIAAE